MKCIAPVLVALITAPAAADAWSMGRPVFSPSLFLPSPTSILRQQEALMNRAFSQQSWTSPRYEITDSDNKFQLAVDVPGVKIENIDVSLEDGVLTVSGHREATDPNYSFKSRFSQSFSLDPAVDVDKFTADLKNGVLTVAAPKDLKKIEANIRKIPIAQAEDDAAQALPKEATHDAHTIEVKEDHDTLDLDELNADKEEVTA